MPKIPRDISGRELSQILRDIAEHLQIEKQSLVTELFKDINKK